MDSDFVGRLEQFNKSIAIVEKPMFFRRVHPGSLTRSPDTGMRSPARIALKEKNCVGNSGRAVEASSFAF